MSDKVYFNSFETTLKAMSPVKSDERYFEGLLTVQMKDKQGEITIVDELYKVLPVWMDRGAPISDTHSNRIIGKGINFAMTTAVNKEGESLPAIKITGKIFKNYELDNVIWNKIKNKEYKGLSFGGATRTNRVPTVMKDGSIAYALKDLEHYEVAVCKDPAVPMALITDFNPIAKAEHNATDRGDGKMVIQCTKMGCFVTKELEPTKDFERTSRALHNVATDNANTVRRAGNRPLQERKVTQDEDGTISVHKPTSRKFKPNRSFKDDQEDYKEYYNTQNQILRAFIEDVEKADLGKYDTFQGKVNALVKEGYPEENAKKIVGAFVKGEKKASEGGGVGDGTLSTETDGVNNAVHNNKDDEEEKRKKEARDHSNSDGDSHSMYNQDVGKSEPFSGGGYFGGIRENIEGTIKQGGLREEETNEIRRDAEDEKEKEKEEKSLERAEKGRHGADFYLPKRGHKVEEDPDKVEKESSVQDGRPDVKPMKQIKQSLTEAIKRQRMILEINELNNSLKHSGDGRRLDNQLIETAEFEKKNPKHIGTKYMTGFGTVPAPAKHEINTYKYPDLAARFGLSDGGKKTRRTYTPPKQKN